jgi:hypothetical protein
MTLYKLMYSDTLQYFTALSYSFLASQRLSTRDPKMFSMTHIWYTNFKILPKVHRTPLEFQGQPNYQAGCQLHQRIESESEITVSLTHLEVRDRTYATKDAARRIL